MTTPTVLFICTHNAGRSQLGAHLMDHVAEGRVHSTSGGVAPADAINPAIAATLAELSIDTTSVVPRAVTAEDLATADVVVTMKPNLDLPGPIHGEHVQWSFPDPANWDADGARGMRDAVRAAVEKLEQRLR
ncbi:low molecular weight phosphatase family protein [Microbacterium sp. HMH0099]|uniref:arsenate-mycothiol transferase ArsC n=1 Tax=Microbacterium sp. HMH0099 TaxID=3414026 RepID=UPI003BF769D7